MASPIAVIAGADTAAIQALLQNAVTQWRADGLTICGMIEERDEVVEGRCSCGVLRNLTTNEGFPMYLDEPPAHTSCHIDEVSVTHAGESVLDQIAQADIVVLSRFGKVEAAGSGLFHAFEAARAQGKPIITSVAPKHDYQWQRFAPDAMLISPSQGKIRDWARSIAAPGS